MANKTLSNAEYLDLVLQGADRAPEFVVLPHEKAQVEAAHAENVDFYRRIVESKVSVSGGDDWHDGAFRTTDNEAKIAAERNAVIAPYLGAVLVEYPAVDEEKVTLGSRAVLSQNGYDLVVDLVGFRKGYPNDVIDEETNEDVIGVSPDSPLGHAIIGQTAGHETGYKNGDRHFKVTITRINQTAVKEFFMDAAEVSLESKDSSNPEK